MWTKYIVVQFLHAKIQCYYLFSFYNQLIATFILHLSNHWKLSQITLKKTKTANLIPRKLLPCNLFHIPSVRKLEPASELNTAELIFFVYFGGQSKLNDGT